MAILLCTTLVLSAQNAYFIQNQGQWSAPFTHKLELAHGAMFFENNGYSLVFLNPPHRHLGENVHHADEPLAAAFKMRWLNCNKSPRITAAAPAQHNLNFYLGNNPANFRSGVAANQELTYENIYPGIHLEYFGQNDQLKYDIILEPEARLELLKMQYTGLDGLRLREGKLVMKTGLGTIVESIPEAYQIIDGEKKVIDCRYQLEGNVVSFELGRYSPQHKLVIDPVLMFASFSGSGDLNFGNSATPAEDGNVYGAGVNFGANYPTTVGTFQPNFAGDSIFNVDITISKFSNDGSQLLYATYLGGKDIDIVHSLIVDNNNNLVVMGSTGSKNFPVGANAFQPNFGGGKFIKSFAFNDFDHGTDMFIAKLDPNGKNLLASTYWGGSGNDGYNELEMNYGDHFRGEVIIDGLGNIALTASSSSLDLPMAVSTGKTKTDTSQDAVVAVFSPDLQNQLWASYLGGTELETGYSIRHHSNKLYVTGTTFSTDFPADSSAFQSNLKGLMDGYVAAFNCISGNVEMASYYGSDSTDQSFFVDLDRYGNVYLLGQTMGLIPITPGKFGTSGSTQFLVKLDDNLQNMLWQSAIGSGNSKQDLVPSAFMVDQCQNIYLAGWNGKANMVGNPSFQNGNTHGLTVSSDAHQSSTDGSDFYFMILGRDATSLVYGSYLGGGDNEHIDGGTSRFSEDGTITQAICTNCNNKGFPSTPGVYAPGSGSPTCNMAIVKFRFDQVLEADARISFSTGIDSICDGLIVNFENSSINATNYKWTFGNGDSSVSEKPQVLYSELGNYEVQLIAYDTICGVNDTAVIIIQHNEATFPDAVIDASYEDCDANYEAMFSGLESSSADQYFWVFGDGETSQAAEPIHRFNHPGPHEIKLVTIDTVCNRSDTATFALSFIDTIPQPKTEVSLNACSNGEIDIQFEDVQGWYQYIWTIDGRTFREPYPFVKFKYPGEKKLTLRIIDTLCNRDYLQDFTVTIDKLKRDSYVPTAFTPDGDGLNDHFEVFGDECMEGDLIKIFNRWGELVFSTENPYYEFWDGKFQGRPAPGGVYSYILLTGQDKIQGSFTLIR